MKIAVVTVVSGRHRHLRAQLAMLARSDTPVDDHIVVAMGDPEIESIVASCAPNTTVVDVITGPPLPVAHARNVGADQALRRGADLLVFLDVDCLPAPDLVRRYTAAASMRSNADALLCGPVTYLPPREGDWTIAELERHTDPHPVRPNPPADTVLAGDDYDLFWSLSFALRAQTWHRCGGFDERYRGYGAEDTDFAATAASLGVGLRWVGGAHAYHQHHPVSSPPIEHLDDIVVNSAAFFRRWQRWPMLGWLDEFERRGLVRRTSSGTIERVRPVAEQNCACGGDPAARLP